jgi:feruloyl esterase
MPFPGQINTLSRVMAGPRDGKGRALYSDWAWDAGVGSPMWSMWRLGIAGRPAMDITLGGAALPTVFSVPPQPVAGTQDALLANELALKFPAAEGLILAHDGKFPQSAWADIAMRSPNLDGFLAHGGKLLVAHGAADPVFSVKDTIAWWDEVKGRYGGRADDVVRLFVVPGMAHCGGGPTTDQFDMLAALIDWVEHGKAPQGWRPPLVSNPWPGRTRPLCAWPGSAYYESGDHNLASSFACRKSQRPRDKFAPAVRPSLPCSPSFGRRWREQRKILIWI